MVAIECGIITDTTKERLQELETTKKELQERHIMGRMREEVRIERTQVEKYLKNGAKEAPHIMLDLLEEKIFVHNDKIELVLKYTSTPKPTPPMMKMKITPMVTNNVGVLLLCKLLLNTKFTPQ